MIFAVDDPSTPQSSADAMTREGGFDLGPDADGDSASPATTLDPSHALEEGLGSMPSCTSSSQGPPDDGSDGHGIALVVDAEVTSYLMMGALSPSLKRHSVTLFEGEPCQEPAGCFVCYTGSWDM